jgi:uncharacterized repeat protein (TIGR03803 family)
VGKPRFWRTIFASFVILAATTVAAPAQTYKTLVSFNGTDAAYPEYAPLVQGRDGNFYGTTRGASAFTGTAFRVTAQAKMTPLAVLAQPYAGLVLSTNGNFYGTTAGGGANSWGTVYKMTSGRKATTVYSFCAQPNCADGVSPLFGLVQASNGNLYGTTPRADAVGSSGTVFGVTDKGKTATFTTLHTFDGTDGAGPGFLIQANDGNLYGVTGSGYGTVFEITTGGTLTTLHTFNNADGAGPSEGLVQATDGNFYGVTQQGGANISCAFGCGTVFKMTPPPDAVLTTLYSFCSQPNCTDGSLPVGALIEGTDGNLYGTTAESGNIAGCGGFGCGTIFQITPEGALTTLYTFCSQPNCIDGAGPQADLLQATSGTFYGVTTGGGTSAVGTVFSLSTGLGPFVSFVQRAANVGQTAQILGQGFKGTTKVSFNGISAGFTVKTATFLMAKVPVGATTGYVTVTTPTSTLTSNVPFQVIP